MIPEPGKLGVPKATGGGTVSMVNCKASLRSPKPVACGVAGSMNWTRAVRLCRPSARLSAPWLPMVNR